MNKILRASKAGFPCNRNLWYSINGYDGKITQRTQRIFDVGTYLEPLVVDWLKADGWDVLYNQGSQKAELEFKIPISGGELAGHPDCFISRPNGIQNVLADIKTMNERTFLQWKREGSLKSKPQYVDQLHIYGMGAIMAGYKVEHLAIVGVNKNNADMHIDIFDFDLDRYAKIKDRAEDIFIMENAPEKNADLEDWCCKYCEFADSCKPPITEKNTKVSETTMIAKEKDIIDAVELLKEARNLKHTGEELEKEAKNVLDEKVGKQGIKTLKANGLTLMIQERFSSSFDKKAFEIANPGLIAGFMKQKSARYYVFAGEEK